LDLDIHRGDQSRSDHVAIRGAVQEDFSLTPETAVNGLYVDAGRKLGLRRTQVTLPAAWTKQQHSDQSVFRYSINAIRSSSERLVPYGCPPLEFPGNRVSNRLAPVNGLEDRTPTCTGSNSQFPT
jgi:hypothetical protein